MKKIIFVMLMFGLLISRVGYADQAAVDAIIQKLTPTDIQKIGSDVYNTPGAQTCLKCHLGGGLGGGWAGAQDLRKPYTWASFNILGGYDALKADTVKFRKDMWTVLEYLFINSGLKWNMGFSKDHPEVQVDWSKNPKGVPQYDMMMWGIYQPEMKAKIKLIQAGLKTDMSLDINDEDMKLLAAYSVFEYIKTFEEAKVNEDGSVEPKILS